MDTKDAAISTAPTSLWKKDAYRPDPTGPPPATSRFFEKRLLAFMYHAAANPHILVADELVNGMHYEWIDACLDAVQGQALLTSQNPLLLDHLPFESAEEVQRRFVLCDRDESGAWIWRNMDLDAADSFYRAYEVGLQHVGEILRTSGLW